MSLINKLGSARAMLVAFAVAMFAKLYEAVLAVLDGDLEALQDTLTTPVQEHELYNPDEIDQKLRQREQAMRADRAQATNLAGLFIGVMVASIIGIAVVIPVVNDVLAQSNVSGTTALVLGLIPLFIAVMLIVSMASPLMRRV